MSFPRYANRANSCGKNLQFRSFIAEAESAGRSISATVPFRSKQFRLVAFKANIRGLAAEIAAPREGVVASLSSDSAKALGQGRLFIERVNPWYRKCDT